MTSKKILSFGAHPDDIEIGCAGTDITNSIDIKLKALSCFESQVKPTRYDEAFKGLARYRGVMSWVGSFAEVFEVIKGEYHF